MSHPSVVGFWAKASSLFVVLGVLLFSGWELCSQQAQAQETAGQADFQSHLSAGEFAPALRIALESKTPQQKNERLSDLSAVQHASGMRRAAIETAGKITDDRILAQIMSGFGGDQGCVVFPGSNEPDTANLGGAVEPDFDSLIELITSTIAPNTWDAVGGPGAIDEFAGGVYIDAQGVLAPLVKDESTGRLGTLHDNSGLSVGHLSVSGKHDSNSDKTGSSHKSSLRMISLPRLERAAQMRVALGKPLTEEMKYLAGLQRIQYVFLYPETGDLVLAGPAESWRQIEEDRVVGVTTNAPALRLEDLVVVMRHMLQLDDARFGCSITPTQENLARTKAFLAESSKTSLAIGKREFWLEALREKLGKQTIDVYGLDPHTRAARVLVEADYRMKLVGMGLEPGVLGVQSYLDQIQIKPGEVPPPMDVLRWWFTLNYQAVEATKNRQAYEIQGQGVKVLSENELLTQQGKRVHTGRSDELNTLFAQSFTENFPQLAAKYPIYAELRNLCDMALVCVLMREENLDERVSWHAVWFRNPEGFPVQLATAPRAVETVINHRVINRRHIVAGVSGGVRVDPNAFVTQDAIKIDSYGDLEAEHINRKPAGLPIEKWWWDRTE